MTKDKIKKSNKFIDFLDSYDKTHDFNMIDYTMMSVLIKDHFNNSKIADKNLLGPLYKMTSINDASLNCQIDHSHSTSIWNNMNTTPYSLFESPYFMWQNQHEF